GFAVPAAGASADPLAIVGGSESRSETVNAHAGRTRRRLGLGYPGRFDRLGGRWLLRLRGCRGGGASGFRRPSRRFGLRSRVRRRRLLGRGLPRLLLFDHGLSFDPHEVLNLADHAAHRRRVFTHDSLTNTLKSQTADRRLLVLRGANRADRPTKLEGSLGFLRIRFRLRDARLAHRSASAASAPTIPRRRRI